MHTYVGKEDFTNLGAFFSNVLVLLMGLNIQNNRLWLVRDGGKWGDGYLCPTTYSLQCYHQNNSALRGAAVWDILMFYWLCGQSLKTESMNHNFFKGKESRSGLSQGPSAFQPSAVPLGLTSSQIFVCFVIHLYMLVEWFPTELCLNVCDIWVQSVSEYIYKSLIGWWNQ